MTLHVNRIILSSTLEIAREYSNTDSVVSRVHATPPALNSGTFVYVLSLKHSLNSGTFVYVLALNLVVYLIRLVHPEDTTSGGVACTRETTESVLLYSRAISRVLDNIILFTWT
jgi:hypothetical protein